MTFFAQLRAILLDALAVTGSLVVLILAPLWVRLRRRQPANQPVASEQPRTATQRLIYLLRLVGFSAFAFIIVGGGLMTYLIYTSILVETAPAPQTVTALPDLPFAVEEISFPGGDNLTMAA